MAYSIKLSSPLPLSKQQNLWNNPLFMQAVAELQSLQPYHLLCYKGDQLVACLPIYEKTRFAMRTLVIAGGSYYQGLNLWLEDNILPARRLLDTLQITTSMAVFLRERYGRIHFNLSPETTDIRGFIWSKLKAVPHYTFVHNCASPLLTLPDERKKIALAAKQGYRFAEEFRISDFMQMFKEMSERKDRHFGYTYEKLESFLIKLHNLGLLHQYNLYQDDRIVSSNLLLQNSNDIAYTVFRATDPEALRNGASSLHTVKLCENMAGKASELDFCGANIPEIARFKAALGLTLKVFYQIRT